MESKIKTLYQLATRFDEGEIFQGAGYNKIKREQIRLYDLLVATFGPKVVPMLDDYTDTLFDQMELEAQHFFQEGYRAACKES